MINRTLLYQDLVNREKEMHIKFTPQHRNIILDIVIEYYYKYKYNKLNKSNVTKLVCKCGNEITEKEIFYQKCLKCHIEILSYEKN